MNIEIRRFENKDRKALRQIYLKSRTQTFVWEKSEEFKLDDFDQATKEEHLLVAIHKDQPIGFISWWPPENFIHNLFVDPQFSQHGVGKALLNACLAKLSRSISLKCLKRNEHAISFYQSQGWMIESEGESKDGDYWLMILDT